MRSHLRKTMTVLTLVIALSALSGCQLVANMFRTIGALTGDRDTYYGMSKIAKGVEIFGEYINGFDDEMEYYYGRGISAHIIRYFDFNVVEDRALNDYINTVGQVLAANSPRPDTFGGYHFTVVNEPTVNAFSAPGGFVFISTGMLKCCKNEDQLAAVLSHEIAHIVLMHGLEEIRQQKFSEAVQHMEQGISDVAGVAVEFSGSLEGCFRSMTLGYPVEQEAEADDLGVIIMREAGYAVNEYKTMLHNMEAVLAQAPHGGFDENHPPISERLTQVEKSIASGGSGSLSQARTNRFNANVRIN